MRNWWELTPWYTPVSILCICLVLSVIAIVRWRRRRRLDRIAGER